MHFKLVHFRLAPLRTRRDIAILGAVHRAMLGKGPKQLHTFFKPAPVLQPCRITRSTHARQDLHCINLLPVEAPDYARRSALGMARIYNMLPVEVLTKKSVSMFQAALQEMFTWHASACSPPMVTPASSS